MYNNKKTQKNTKIQKKKKTNPSWGLTHPPTSEFFSDFLFFFNLAKPLRGNTQTQAERTDPTKLKQHVPPSLWEGRHNK